MKLFAVAALGLPLGVDAHGYLVNPPSRNAADAVFPEFADGKFPIDKVFYGCNCGNYSGVGCEPGIRGEGGQACLWFRCV